jgi:hypothetical protein
MSAGFGAGNDFANYRIKWTADVETFFQKKLKNAPSSRKLVTVAANDTQDDYENLVEHSDQDGHGSSVASIPPFLRKNGQPSKRLN